MASISFGASLEATEVTINQPTTEPRSFDAFQISAAPCRTTAGWTTALPVLLGSLLFTNLTICPTLSSEEMKGPS